MNKPALRYRQLTKLLGAAAVGLRLRSRNLWLSVLLAWVTLPAHASMFKGEALDKAADVLTWVVIVLVPLCGITLFWLVHILPEKVAEKRHHPQKTAINTLCLLSLMFGGMLWPLAWLWAYVKPVGYKLAYGTDKHNDYFLEAVEKAEKGELSPATIAMIREELAGIEARGQLTPELRAVLKQLSKPTPPPTTQQSQNTGSLV